MTERPIIFSAEMVRAILAGRKTQTRRVIKPQPWVDDMGNACWKNSNFGQNAQGVPHIQSLASPVPSSRTKQVLCPYGAPGDLLWVRETWCLREPIAYPSVHYRADGEHVVLDDGDGFTAVNKDGSEKSPWRPSIHMPRWASRVTLEVKSVRVERLQDISEDDARAEGCEARPFPGPWWQGYRDLGDGQMLHHQAVGDTPPDWMIEPKKMPPTPWLDRSARDAFRSIWMDLHGPGTWDDNPWVWVLSFERVKP